MQSNHFCVFSNTYITVLYLTLFCSSQNSKLREFLKINHTYLSSYLLWTRFFFLVKGQSHIFKYTYHNSKSNFYTYATLISSIKCQIKNCQLWKGFPNSTRKPCCWHTLKYTKFFFMTERVFTSQQRVLSFIQHHIHWQIQWSRTHEQ